MTSKACRWVVAKTSLLCVGDLYGGGETCYFHHKYELNCGAGPSGGSGTGGSDGEDPLGSGSGSGGSNPIVGSPIIECPVGATFNEFGECVLVEEVCGEGYTLNENGECVEEEQIENNLTDPCARGIFTELENGIFEDHPLKPEVEVPVSNPFTLNFSESILKLFNDSNTFNYILQNGIPDNPNANASTDTDLISTNPNRWSVTTTINNAYLYNATELSIARTMIHELAHGYLSARSNELDFTIAMTLYASENGIDTSDTNAFHHEFMGQYINGMAYSLYEWDKQYGTGSNQTGISSPNDLLGWDYYYAMAFSGQFQTNSSGDIVLTTDTFLELVPDATERQNFADIILNELKGNSNAQGTDCN